MEEELTQQTGEQVSLYGESVCIDDREYAQDLAEALREGLQSLINGSAASLLISRTSDRISSLEIDRVGTRYLITGCEDSADRGDFGFCLYSPSSPDKSVETCDKTFPYYGTTDSHDDVSIVAYCFLREGELVRSLSWIVTLSGLGAGEADLDPMTILHKGNTLSLADFVRSLKL